MSSLDKSEIMKSVLKTLISISSRKTDFPYTVMTIEDIMKRLETQFGFLKHVHINNNFYTEESGDVITVMSEINRVSLTQVGNAIHSIIVSLNRSLGENAGHFFIKEIRNRLSDDSLNVIKEMGVDLGLMQLESEVIRLEKELNERKKES